MTRGAIGGIRRFLSAAVVSLAISCGPAAADHGFAYFGDLKYPADFQHFDYVNPKAPKGGRLRQGTMLVFNSLNPMRFPGNTPNELFMTFDSLMVRSQDEPGSFYGKIAQGVAMAPDFSWIRFHLRPEARWHDGSPITTIDVAFTFRTLAKHGLPGPRALLKDVEIVVLDPMTIEFRTNRPGARRHIGLVATFPIQSAAYWADRDPGEISLEIPLGSGPYRLSTVAMNDRTVLDRVPEYWGRDLPVNRGRWNFDRIETLHFRERTPMVEALKAGRLDINREFNGNHWPHGYHGPRHQHGELVLSEFRERSAGRLSALVLNLRRPPLDDRRVRAALACAFDGAWMRKTLFGGVYEAPGSLYGATEMAARGPAGPQERALLAPFLQNLPAGILDAPAPPNCAGDTRRERLRRADALLREAGWTVRDGVRVNAEGAPLKLEYVSGRTGLERAVSVYADGLKTLGIRLEIALLDFTAVRAKILGHEFDISQTGFKPGFPPGGAERSGWHSENADVDGYALSGTKVPALDAVVAALENAAEMEDILAATRAFDRIVRWEQYLIPLWRHDQIWIAHDARLRFPDTFAVRRFGHLSTLWWERAPPQ